MGKILQQIPQVTNLDGPCSVILDQVRYFAGRRVPMVMYRQEVVDVRAVRDYVLYQTSLAKELECRNSYQWRGIDKKLSMWACKRLNNDSARFLD